VIDGVLVGEIEGFTLRDDWTSVKEEEDTDDHDYHSCGDEEGVYLADIHKGNYDCKRCFEIVVKGFRQAPVQETKIIGELADDNS
jgi:hypothetical protein